MSERKKAAPISLQGHLREPGMECPHCTGVLRIHRGALSYYLDCDQKPGSHRFLLTSEEEDHLQLVWK